MKTALSAIAAIAGLTGCAQLALARQPAVKVEVDYPAFLARQDLVYAKMPNHFDNGAFLGNGLLGATIYQDGDQRLRWEMGRADVTEHRRDNNRLPIGGLVLTTAGKILGGTLRLDLWNAEVRGEVKTDQGTLKFRSFIHTRTMALCTDLETSGGEQAAKFAWEAAVCRDAVNSGFNDPPNPPSRSETVASLPVCIQPRFAGGEFATAWTEQQIPAGRRIILSIADSFPATTAGQDVVQTVKAQAAADFAAALQEHRDWWHAFYPKSFVSLPDPKAESFYWIQWYKLASASRPDRVPVDLLGPWFRNTGWPRIWWNLNIEILYLPVYTGNRLELGESFINFLDKKRDNFFRNGKEIWKFDDCATVPHTTDYEGLRGDGSRAPDGYINPGDFTWALHNYYLHYRYSMDAALVTDRKKHAFYPLLRGSVNLYLRLLKKGADGKLHLPVLHSPEYGNAADNNYNLALLRWGCQTLLALNQRYRFNDPLASQWQETLDQLVAYPVDQNGLRIGADMAFANSHRHWSHMLMIHPLHIMTGEQPENRELINRSIQHWLTVDGSREVYGWSRASAASLYATLGDGDKAFDQIQRHMSDQRFVRPNTMYIEGDPVIECSIYLNRAMQDLLLQSWGGTISVFPAAPKTWDAAVFHDLRAEGAFLVSARRQGGKTAWIRIKSLAGEPCRIKTDLPATLQVRVNRRIIALKSAHAGVYELPLAKGDEAVLVADAQTVPVVAPLPATSSNPWGIKE